MNQPPRQRPTKNETDRRIDAQARLHSLEYVTAATQILTIICLVKGNPAWKGSLSLLFFGVAFGLLYKYQQYKEGPYRQVGIVFLAVGIALMAWFGFTG